MIEGQIATQEKATMLLFRKSFKSNCKDSIMIVLIRSFLAFVNQPTPWI